MIPQDDTATHPRPDFARIEPAPRFLPHCAEPHIVAMGLSSMEGSWIDADPSHSWRAHKLKMRERYGDRVYQLLEESTQAANEFTIF